MTARPEKQLQQRLMRTAHDLGLRPYHTLNSKGSEPGFPDLVMPLPPTLFFWELKSTTGRVKPEQQAWMDALNACTRIEARVIRPEDAELVLRDLTGWRAR